MKTTLLDHVRSHADALAESDGVARTPIPGLSCMRAETPSELDHALSRPIVCLVVQGSKHVAMGNQSFHFSAGDSLLIAADVPTASQITGASPDRPYYSLVLELDPVILADIMVAMKAARPAGHAPIHVGPTDTEGADAALRLMSLLV